LLVKGTELKAETIANKGADIRAASGKALRDQGIDIPEAEWPGLLEGLKAIANSETDIPFEKTSEAIKALHQLGSAEAVIAQYGPSAEPAETQETVEKAELKETTGEEEGQEDWSQHWRKFTKGEKAKGEKAASAPAVEQPVFRYVHDPHGIDKHFNKPLKKGAQWSLSLATADSLMLNDVQNNMDTLVANSLPGKTTSFYLSKDRGDTVGAVDYKTNLTTCYTIQIDVNRKDNVIYYHGYPELTPTIGLGRTTKKKDLPFT
jgi:hypothetical protein